MDFSHDEPTRELMHRMESFLTEAVYPAEPVLARQLAESPDSWRAQPIVAELQQEARSGASGTFSCLEPIRTAPAV